MAELTARDTNGAKAPADGNRHESLADFRSTDADKRRELIALQAYYAAELRGFEGDGEIEDSLQAERVVDRRLADGNTAK